MLTTEKWAESFGISTAPTVPSIAEYDEPCPFTARQVAMRVVILQGVVAVAAGVDPEPIVEWYQDQSLSCEVSPKEAAFLSDPSGVADNEVIAFQWRQESEWTLLWAIGKVEALGLPTHCCDTRRIVDQLIPSLGDDIEPFIDSAKLRPPGELLAEDDRVYDLWCQMWVARRNGEPLPNDLNEYVLYERVYAFEWLHGLRPWDEVTCDA